jgi:methyltransferase (TIGR00027 family)
MERSDSSQNVLTADSSKRIMEWAGRSSRTAIIIAWHRFDESQMPEGERICYDPYAVHFLSPEMLAQYRDPIKLKAGREYLARLIPGLGDSIRARVRYFDDVVKQSIDEGLEQLVILGAGYDTRAYRIEGIKDKVKVFEVDHPDTQAVKTEKIEDIFGKLPDHVFYVPVYLATKDLCQRLQTKGYDRSRKTLFLMEGLVMYLSPKAVDEMLAFVVENTSTGSAILFDYFLQSVVDGTCEIGKNIRDFLKQVGEPVQFGIDEGIVEAFLADRGFSKIKNMTSEDYKRAYFHGANKGRTVCSLINFVYAVVE